MNNSLKIVTWNCGGAFRKKFQALASFDADIYVIQECENPDTTKDKAYKEWYGNFLWTGENNHKGLGIFAKNGIQIENLDWETNVLKYFIACRVNGILNLVGAWCNRGSIYQNRYIGQLWQYIQLNKKRFENTLIAGDFNSNVIWDKKSRIANHSNVVRELAEINIASFYHKYHKEEQGKESKPTFYLQKNINKPYHIDYIFGSGCFHYNIIDLNIGQVQDWLAFSDHMPVLVVFNT